MGTLVDRFDEHEGMFHFFVDQDLLVSVVRRAKTYAEDSRACQSCSNSPHAPSAC